MESLRRGYEWGQALLVVVGEIREGTSTADEVLERYRNVALESRTWCLLMLESLRVYPHAPDLAFFGVRMICYGILIGSASSEDDADEVLTALFEKMAKLSMFPEDEVAPEVPFENGEKNDRTLFTEQVMRSLLEEEWEDLGNLMAWACELAGLGMIVGNRLNKKDPA